MRFATLEIGQQEQACVLRSDDTWAPLSVLPGGTTGDLLTLIASAPTASDMASIREKAEALTATSTVSKNNARYRPPYRRAQKIWGIGLNYGDHARDLSEEAPQQPASFIKGNHTIIGHGDEIVIPRQSRRTTSEAELGLIMGTQTRDISTDTAMDYVFGVCAILDQTAEDILQLNSRYLTRAKNFPTFFSFGPEVVTLDEFLAEQQIDQVRVTTRINGDEVRSNVVANMTHGPRELIAFHSQMMPLFPGDVISTGTPGAGHITANMRVEAHVSGLCTLSNSTRDQQDLHP